MPLILGANSVSGGYEVDNSLRFNPGSSDFLERTLSGTSTNRKLCTFSYWVKRSDISDTNQGCIGGFLTNSSGQNLQIGFFNNGFYAVYYDGAIVRLNLVSSALARDVSAWYHVVIAIDTTQATTSDRAKMYVNGVQVTSFTTSDYPVQNVDFPMTNGFTTHIGKMTFIGSTTEYLDGYMSEVNFIDGQQLTPSSFGQTDPSVPSSGIWIPKAYTGSYGTNGFYLEFQNSGALGTDSSGNGNNFTVNNLTSVDQSTDTPTNNFCTINPLDVAPSQTFTEGNLACSYGATNVSNRSSFAVDTGKWYWEMKVTSISGGGILTGVTDSTQLLSTWVGATTYGYGYYSSNGFYYNNGSSSTSGNSFTTNDIIGIAFDATNGKIYFSKNGTFQNSGDPVTQTNPAFTGLTGRLFFPATSGYSGDAINYNFGSPPFTIASGNADANGYGNFEYAVPSGFYALNTKNLADYG